MNVESGSFPVITTDKIRYADTDRQGHVNNAVFSTFLETGRVELLYSDEARSLGDNTTFVIARKRDDSDRYSKDREQLIRIPAANFPK